MLRKMTTPIVDGQRVIGTRTEYRLFGILLMRKELFTPEKWGINEYRFYSPI